MSTTTPPSFKHEEFCLPRPGEDGPRMETYRQPKYAADGITQAGTVEVCRCIECGAACYDGRRYDGPPR